jgi:hypothetical protein
MVYTVGYGYVLKSKTRFRATLFRIYNENKKQVTQKAYPE